MMFKRVVCVSAFGLFLFSLTFTFEFLMSQKSCVIFCRCSANVISDTKQNDILEGLKKQDVHVYELHDLCAFSVNEKDVLDVIGKEFQQKILVACYPRAVKNMLLQSGIDFGNFEVLNFKELSANEILSKLETEFGVVQGKARFQTRATKLDVPAWFPVIDKERCTLCGRCARFCLFGVYTFDKKNLNVVNPLACKNRCPACGRTCPASAIIFPRLAENSVLAGDEPGSTQISVDKGNLLTTLNERNSNRRNILRQGVMERAKEERRKALEELKISVQRKE